MPNYYIPKHKFKIVYKKHIDPYLHYYSDKEFNALVAIIWLSGLRICDTLKLDKDSIFINGKDKSLLITVKASKGGTLANPSFGFNDPYVVSVIMPYIQDVVYKLFSRSKRRYQQMLLKANKGIHGTDTTKYITFHYLRHSRITYLARVLKAFPEEIKAWTGHRTTQFEEYIAPRRVERFKGRFNE